MPLQGEGLWRFGDDEQREQLLCTTVSRLIKYKVELGGKTVLDCLVNCESNCTDPAYMMLHQRRVLQHCYETYVRCPTWMWSLSGARLLGVGQRPNPRDTQDSLLSARRLVSEMPPG